jgi:GNAT superfamily N-acetyltransferase
MDGLEKLPVYTDPDWPHPPRDRPVPAIKLDVEPWSKFWPDAKPLMLAHRAELNQDDSRTPLRPDHFRIEAIAEAGGLLILGARYCESLVGYSIWYLMPSLETEGLLIAMQAPWYVKPEFRSLGVGLRLLRRAEILLKQRGVRLLAGHLPETGPGADLWPLFERKGAKKIGVEFHLWLDPLGKGVL